MDIYDLIYLYVWSGQVVTDIWCVFHVSSTSRNIFSWKLVFETFSKQKRTLNNKEVIISFKTF